MMLRSGHEIREIHYSEEILDYVLVSFYNVVL